MSQEQPFIWKSQGNSLSGPKNWDRVSGDLQGGVNSVSQVDGVSDVAQLAGSAALWG